MGIIKIVKDSFGKIFSKKFNIIALIMIIIISVILGLICVIAFWNPEEKMQNLPVVVVNLDEGAQGQNIIDNLKDNTQVKWIFTNEDVLSNGIENTDYYFGFSIPKDFTASVESAKDSEPIQAQITYYSNMRKNFLLSQFSKNVKSVFENAVSTSVTKEYATQTFDTLFDVKDGLNKASDGSGELLEGAESIHDGALEYKEGVGALSDGVTELNNNTKLFSRKMGDLENGALELKSAIDALDSGTSELNGGTSEISAGASVLSESTSLLLLEMYQGSAVQAEKVAAILATYKQTLDSPYPDSAKLSILTEIYANLLLLFDGINNSQIELLGALEQINTGASSLDESLIILSENSKKLSDATSQINEATSKLNDSISQLNAGSQSLGNGVSSLSNGADLINEKTEILTDAISELTDGAEELNVELSNSADEMKDKLVNDSQSMGEFISEPVVFESDIYGEVNNYGSGFAPLFLSIGLWVGALMLFFIIKNTSSQHLELNSFQIVTGNFIPLAIFSILEALAISLCALAIGLEVTNPSVFIIFTICGSLSFVSIIQSFHILFGELISKAICVLAVILQIASSGGTFPVELTGRFFETINPYLPFSYTIDGFREILSGGNMMVVNERLISLAIFFVVSFALSVFFCKRLVREQLDASA